MRRLADDIHLISLKRYLAIIMQRAYLRLLLLGRFQIRVFYLIIVQRTRKKQSLLCSLCCACSCQYFPAETFFLVWRTYNSNYLYGASHVECASPDSSTNVHFFVRIQLVYQLAGNSRV